MWLVIPTLKVVMSRVSTTVNTCQNIVRKIKKNYGEIPTFFTQLLQKNNIVIIVSKLLMLPSRELDGTSKSSGIFNLLLRRLEQVGLGLWRHLPWTILTARSERLNKFSNAFLGEKWWRNADYFSYEWQRKDPKAQLDKKRARRRRSFQVLSTREGESWKRVWSYRQVPK